MPAGVHFGFVFPDPAIKGTRVTFDVNLKGAGVTDDNRRATYAAHDGVAQLVYRVGDAAPQIPGSNDRVPLGQGRQQQRPNRVVRRPRRRVGGARRRRDLHRTRGAAQPVVRSGAAAPGVAGATLRYLGAPTINDAGKIAHWAQLAGPGIDETANAESLWAGTPGSMSMLARAGSHAAGTPAGVNFKFFNDPIIDDGDHVLFESTLTGTGVVADWNDAGVCARRPSERRRSSSAPASRLPD